MKIGLELFLLIAIPAVLMATGNVVAVVANGSALAPKMASLVWFAIVAATFAYGFVVFGSPIRYLATESYLPICVCLGVSAGFLLRSTGVFRPSNEGGRDLRLIRLLAGQRVADRFTLAQHRMRLREERARNLGVSVTEVLKREKSGDITLD
jgi:hypothetical protein